VETSPDFVERVSDRSRVARSVRRTLELSVLSGKDCQVEFTGSCSPIEQVHSSAFGVQIGTSCQVTCCV